MSTRPYRDVETLLEALPYIREFHGKTVVIKYGGAAMVDESLKAEFARDVVLLKYVGMNPVIVHGGGPEITSMSERLDLPVNFIDGLRVSDQETVQIARMVLVGKVNSDIVLLINGHGQPAVGISGEDARLFQCTKKRSAAGADLGFVGDIKHVNTGLLNHLTDDYVPVIASVGADSDGNSYNINADDAASAVASALGAYKIMFMTDVAGWLLDATDPDSLISEASVSELEEAIPSIGGGMRPKLQACIDAVRSGVGTASIVDGRVPHSLLTEMFTDAGSGTIIRPDGSCA